MALNEENRTGNSSGWSYWLEKLRQIFPSEEGDPRGYQFTIAICDRFREPYPLEDETLENTWFASLQAIQSLNSSCAELEARFILSSEKIEPNTDPLNQPVHIPVSVDRDFNEPPPQTPPRLFYFFTFTDLLPVTQNIKLFEESAIARIKNFRSRTPESSLADYEEATG